MSFNNIKDTQNNKSFASEMLKDLKQENKTIKVLLGLSILANILIVALMR